MTRAWFIVAATASLCAAISLAEATPKPLSPGKAVAIYAPPPEISTETRVKHLAGEGVFILSVRADGTFSHVEVAKSTGQPLLDKASIDAFRQSRFRPHSATKVKIPISYTGNYPKPQKT